MVKDIKILSINKIIMTIIIIKMIRKSKIESLLCPHLKNVIKTKVSKKNNVQSQNYGFRKTLMNSKTKF